MKKHLTQLSLGMVICGAMNAQTIVQGPSSSQSSYLQPLVPSSTITSVFTASNAIGSYTMAGLPDGIGAYDNGNGSFTLLMNHEMGNNVGAVHAHGSIGAFVSKWVINKSNLQVQSGQDLTQNVMLWTGTTYTTYNATTPSTLAAFARFCSGDLPAITAFYNEATGKGTLDRIYMNGEENGSEGRAFGHIATGSEAGNSYELPHLGKASWENQVASPWPQDKTIVVGLDDTTPGQVYVYVGTKTSSGTPIARAGLTGGKLYGVAVLGLLNESNSSVPTANTVFNLIDLGTVQNLTGATLNTNSNNVGVTNFLRPEDGAWDPSNPRDFYFVTTNSFSANSRMWRLRFNDISNPEQGGTITAVLTGSEGQKMLDNIGIDHYGHIMLQEDVGGNIHNGKIWQYRTSTNSLSLFAQHDTTRFITGGANYLTIDEESSGIIDAQEILGPGMFLLVDQAHYSVPTPVIEGGQILTLYNPSSANANPEINLQGNTQNIASGTTTVSVNNNTNFGPVNLGDNLVKAFVIQNAGPGPLTVKTLSIGGANAGDFTFLSPPLLPLTIPANGSYSLYLRFTPGLETTRQAIIYVGNNDFDEFKYSFAVQGTGVTPEINVLGNTISIASGNSSVSSNDNTDFGSTFYNNAITKSFDIQNTGTGNLSISNISISGTNTSIWTFVNAPAVPFTLTPSAVQAFTVQYLPVIPNTTDNAMIHISNSDANESAYTFMISGKSMMDVGILEQNSSLKGFHLFPVPADAKAQIEFESDNNGTASIKIIDLLGKLVKEQKADLSKGSNTVSIETADLQSGQYILDINTGKQNQKTKLQVMH